MYVACATTPAQQDLLTQLASSSGETQQADETSSATPPPDSVAATQLVVKSLQVRFVLPQQHMHGTCTEALLFMYCRSVGLPHFLSAGAAVLESITAPSYTWKLPALCFRMQLAVHMLSASHVVARMSSASHKVWVSLLILLLCCQCPLSHCVSQGQVEGMQASLDELSAHVALHERSLNPEVASSAASSGVTAGDLDLPSLEEMEPQREFDSRWP